VTTASRLARSVQRKPTPGQATYGKTFAPANDGPFRRPDGRCPARISAGVASGARNERKLAGCEEPWHACRAGRRTTAKGRPAQNTRLGRGDRSSVGGGRLLGGAEWPTTGPDPRPARAAALESIGGPVAVARAGFGTFGPGHAGSDDRRRTAGVSGRAGVERSGSLWPGRGRAGAAARNSAGLRQAAGQQHFAKRRGVAAAAGHVPGPRGHTGKNRACTPHSAPGPSNHLLSDAHHERDGPRLH